MTKPRLLLVDDDRDTLDGLERILARDGYVVSAVLSSFEALNLLSQKKFDIVVTDLELPKMGGLALIRELSKMDVPMGIVVVTACNSIKKAVEAMKCGADDYLTKPVDIKELESVLEGIWEGLQLIA